MTLLDQEYLKSDLPLPGRRQGKVRDIYQAQLNDATDVLLIIASDRLSAFDVVMPNGIAGKGIVLTQISKFWFDMIKDKMSDQVTHHLIATDASEVSGLTDEQKAQLKGRVMVGKRAKVIPIECVVRGYITGSGWKEYKQVGSVCCVALPEGLKQCDKLPEPIFTPTTKDDVHDEAITFEQGCEMVGSDLMTKIRDLSLSIYKMAHDYAAERGIILADTKFEFGTTEDGSILLIDEVLTPDSSRFWPADDYEPGRDQASFDKQIVRNYLQELCDDGKWDKQNPGPVLPDEVINKTKSKYLEAYKLLTGTDLQV
ncbi:MAG TPA: phosphoribosylaminoimidazolesuccinocarboxamide synthase [Phycisphaerales bacterium]|nr:phosphoribosylaminoimidazolesuccinocarboxamide synthase [Phycisphaerales bacterium]